MLPLDTLLLFFLTACVLALTPGPDNVFVLTQSALYGRRAGWLITLGLCTGLLGHTAAVALGVAAIFQTSALAFELLKLVGAGYLLWLAWQALRASSATANTVTTTSTAESNRREHTADSQEHRASPAANIKTTQPDISAGRLYRRGIIMNLSNPKVSVFFLAFLPQFTRPDLGPVSVQIIVLGIAFMVSTILVFGAIAISAGSLGQFLRRSPQVEVFLNRIAGIVFIGLALKLATTRQYG